MLHAQVSIVVCCTQASPPAVGHCPPCLDPPRRGREPTLPSQASIICPPASGGQPCRAARLCELSMATWWWTSNGATYRSSPPSQPRRVPRVVPIFVRIRLTRPTGDKRTTVTLRLRRQVGRLYEPCDRARGAPPDEVSPRSSVIVGSPPICGCSGRSGRTSRRRPTARPSRRPTMPRTSPLIQLYSQVMEVTVRTCWPLLSCGLCGWTSEIKS